MLLFAGDIRERVKGSGAGLGVVVEKSGFGEAELGDGGEVCEVKG